MPTAPGASSSTVASSEYKLRATVLKAPYGDLQSCMEMAKVADLIAFVASASYYIEGSTSLYIDSFGSECLSVLRSLGLPSTAVLIRDLPTDIKKKNDYKKMCISSISSEFPEDCKFYPADTKDELHKFMWLFKEQRLTVPHWRTQRPYLMSQKVDMVADNCTPGRCTLLLTGYLRARSLSVNQLVHVAGAGDFQLSKIEVLKDPVPLNPRTEQDAMDTQDDEIIRLLEPSEHEPLVVENEPDPLSGEQTWPTEADRAEADRNQKEKHLRKRALAHGTSEYQEAWEIGDSEDEDSDVDNETDGMMLDSSYTNEVNDLNNQGISDDDQASLEFENSDQETDMDSVMLDGEMTNEQKLDEIQKIKNAHAEDEEFPDEVDTPMDIPARKRFAKYRGLKSFRTSTWDPQESLPQDYARIFEFNNISRTQKHVLAKALEIEQGNCDHCVASGSYLRLHVKEVPVGAASKLCELAKSMPITACGLLQHESKMSVLHFRYFQFLNWHNSPPLKGKEKLVFHVGFRQFVTRPIFSTDNFNSDKHKMERFLHGGRFSIASIYAPISFAPLPLIVLRSVEGNASFAASGSLKSIDPRRIILKKIILSGYPQRVSKLKATVRYMFHNPDDVRWFKPVDVWTKCGRRGRIKEPVGTHGAMKCVFNGVLQQHDTVCMSLYKRVYPKWPEHLFPLLDA
ncbi:pre-rRNA-processing protein TSR1-like protein [Cucumis melo var. makuwa]|uniref:Pre-rRNA-processing protein TSR1-like protein n=1 Tax=Cucumis melo var. makuwa TaxID=1194695 RepID=A0A5D3DMV4_CUCMM|nr:pre-rRNA-processing protein TSR1-like protein [Cucumis melo var. makuwa]